MQAISYAYGQNHFLLDPDLPVLLDHYLPSWRENLNDLRDFGTLMGTEAYETLYHIDHDAPPVLVMHDRSLNPPFYSGLSPSKKAGLSSALAGIFSGKIIVMCVGHVIM